MKDRSGAAVTQKETDRIKKAGESYNDFFNYYLDNKIFIPKNTIEKLDTIRSDYFNSYHDYTFGRQYGIKDEFTYEKSKASGDNSIGPFK